VLSFFKSFVSTKYRSDEPRRPPLDTVHRPVDAFVYEDGTLESQPSASGAGEGSE